MADLDKWIEKILQRRNRYLDVLEQIAAGVPMKTILKKYRIKAYKTNKLLYIEPRRKIRFVRRRKV